MKLKELYPSDRIIESSSGIVFTVAGKNLYGDGILLITDKVIAQGAMDAPEPESETDSFTICGNSDYSLSNLHQWLNSDKKNWYSKTHEYDTPPSEEYLSLRPNLYEPIGCNPYYEKQGFLSRFSEGFKDLICESAIPCAKDDNPGLYYINAKVFIPSAAELGLDTKTVCEGKRLELFEDFRMRYSSPSEECLMEGNWQPAYFRSNRMFWYWLRTPNPTSKGFFAYSHFVNPFAYKFACCPQMGIRPMLSVSAMAEVSLTESAWGIYRFESGVCR